MISTELLAQLRNAKRLRQQDVAAKIAISQPSYSKIERSLDYFSPLASRKAAILLALGRRVPGGESAPSFALVQLDAHNRIDFLFTSGRLGLYHDPDIVYLA